MDAYRFRHSMRVGAATAIFVMALGGCQAPWRGNAAPEVASETAAAPDAAAPDAAAKAGAAAAPADPTKTAPAATADHAPGAAKSAGTPGDPASAAAANPASAAAGASALTDERWVQTMAAPTETPGANPAAVSAAPATTLPPITLPGKGAAASAVVTTTPANPAATKYRWRHFGLEAWLARGTWRPELAEALGNSQRIVATNAAIVMAREGVTDSRVVPALAVAADDVNLRLPLRYAAVEGLACVASPAAQAELARLTDQQIQFLHNTPSAYAPLMHAELLLGLTRSRGAGELGQDNPRFAAGLASPAPEVRRVALAAWLDPDRKELPPLVLELRRDPDPRVRATALAVLAVQRPQPAETLLLAALDDTDLTVRIAAIGALGKLGTPAARAALDKLRSHSHEAARIESVRALARLAGYRAVILSAHDKSWRVRQAVAESLSQAGDNASAENVELARSFVHDPSLDVQRQMIQSLASWPLPAAGTVLLSAMSEAGYQTRKDAAVLLANRWPAAAEFPIEALAPERATSVAALTARWKTEFLAASDNMSQPDGPGAGANVSAKDLSRLRYLIDACGDQRILPATRQSAIDSLVAYGAVLPATLESPSLAEQGALPEVVYEEVLPKISPVFAALDALNSNDVRLRRNGATQLSAIAGGKPLGGLALERLVVLARRETDPVVWQSLLQTTATDPRAGAVQLAYLAVGNASSDVRRRACDYLATHADPRHTSVLLPMLQDPSSTVVIAAVRGLGAIGSIADTRPLIALLLTPDRELRLEVATNLVRMKVDDGRAALARMALDPDMQLRLDVAKRMGELAEPVFLPTLIQMTAESNDVGRMALESLAKLTGQDFSHDADGALLPRDAQTAQWQAWYRRQQLSGVLPAAAAETASAAKESR